MASQALSTGMCIALTSATDESPWAEPAQHLADRSDRAASGLPEAAQLRRHADQREAGPAQPLEVGRIELAPALSLGPLLGELGRDARDLLVQRAPTRVGSPGRFVSLVPGSVFPPSWLLPTEECPKPSASSLRDAGVAESSPAGLRLAVDAGQRGSSRGGTVCSG